MARHKPTLALRENEKIIKEVRHYGLIIVPHLFLSFLILLLDFFLLFYLFTLSWWGPAIFFSIVAIVLIYVYRLLFLWKRNKIIITNKRVIDVERSGFFNHLVSDFSYQKIKNVTGKKKGVWQTIFKYGDVSLDLVDQPLPFELYNIKHPFKLLEMINEWRTKHTIVASEKKTDRNSKEIIDQLENISEDERQELLEKITVHFDDKEDISFKKKKID